MKRPRSELAKASDVTGAIRIVHHDRAGFPEKRAVVREPARVRALVEALGIDGHSSGPCPADYADADVWLTLSGSDVYAKRNVYVFGLETNETPTVVTVTTAGCVIGAPSNVPALKSALVETKD